jgi:hypothetical protein
MFSGIKERDPMSVRAYLLLEITGGNCEYAVQTLQSKTGVVIVDWLEGRPDIIVMVEAPDRQRLAETMMPVIGSIDGITEDLHLLVTRDDEIATGLRSYRSQVKESKIARDVGGREISAMADSKGDIHAYGKTHRHSG